MRAIDVEPSLEDLGIIVAAHRLAFVCRLFGAPPDAVEQGILVDVQLKHRIELDTPAGEFPIECFGLRDRARKAVKDEAVGRVRMVDTAGDNRNHDVIRHELAARGIKLDAVLELEVDEDALLDRIRGRAEEAANKGEPVRRDDNPEVFKTRLDVYREQTAPVTEYYRSRGLLNIVDGLQPIDAVTEQLTAALAALPSDQIRSDVR